MIVIMNCMELYVGLQPVMCCSLGEHDQHIVSRLLEFTTLDIPVGLAKECINSTVAVLTPEQFRHATHVPHLCNIDLNHFTMIWEQCVGTTSKITCIFQ